LLIGLFQLSFYPTSNPKSIPTQDTDITLSAVNSMPTSKNILLEKRGLLSKFFFNRKKALALKQAERERWEVPFEEVISVPAAGEADIRPATPEERRLETAFKSIDAWIKNGGGPVEFKITDLPPYWKAELKKEQTLLESLDPEAQGNFFFTWQE
jgi:hypothetical protein